MGLIRASCHVPEYGLPGTSIASGGCVEGSRIEVMADESHREMRLNQFCGCQAEGLRCRGGNASWTGQCALIINQIMGIRLESKMVTEGPGASQHASCWTCAALMQRADCFRFFLYYPGQPGYEGFYEKFLP